MYEHFGYYPCKAYGKMATSAGKVRTGYLVLKGIFYLFFFNYMMNFKFLV